MQGYRGRWKVIGGGGGYRGRWKVIGGGGRL